MKVKIFRALPLLLVGALLTQCKSAAGGYTLKAVELTAGQNIYAQWNDSSAQAAFNGASGLSLSPADFAVNNGSTVSAVTVEGDQALVTITLTDNTTDADRLYAVSIAPTSEKICGDAQVIVTQGYQGDTRVTLTAGTAAQVTAADTSAEVTFSGATGIAGLGAADFTVSGNASVSAASVAEDTATVTITFSANTDSNAKTYTVGIASTSTLVKGGAQVVVTQEGKVIDHAFYISYSTGDDSNPGTSEAAPWKTIAKVNAHGAYNAGEAILFKCGDVWEWDAATMEGSAFLAPQGSGAEGNPILISSYGSGVKPKLDGKGIVNDIILLHNQHDWEISNLEITSMVEGWTNPMARDDTQGILLQNKDLRGIHVTGQDVAELKNFYLHDLSIHDVTGHLMWINGLNDTNTTTWAMPGVMMSTGWDKSKRTGGILFECLEPQTDTPVIFKNVTLEDSVFERNIWGAFTIKQWYGGSSGKHWASRSTSATPPAYADSNFKPHQNIIVRRNYIDQTGWYHGDGIYLTSVINSLAEDNVVKNPGVCGIEIYYGDNIIVQRNEVYGSTAKGNGSDSNAIDPDRQTTNCIVQYNYVHDNGDGILLCGFTYNTVILRYNIFYNNMGCWVRDTVANGTIHVYNNVLYNTKAQWTSSINFFNTGDGSNEAWIIKNNVFYNEYAGATGVFTSQSNHTYDNNVYYGVNMTAPASDTNAINAPPRFAGTPVFFTSTSVDEWLANQQFLFLKPGTGSPLVNTGVTYTKDSAKFNIDTDGKDWAGTALSGATDIGIFSSPFNGLGGIVSDEDGFAVADTSVTLGEGHETTTDAEGWYQFDTVSEGTYELAVAGQTVEAALGISADTPAYHPITVTLTPVYKTLTGTVNSGSSPLEGVTVTISKNAVSLSGATNASGVYTIANVPSGNNYTVTAAKEGYESKTTEDVSIPRAGTDPIVIDFDLISSTHVYYNEPFDTLTDWEILKQQDADTVEIVVDQDDAENNLLHINKTTSGSTSNKIGIYNKTDANAYGIFTIETKMKRSVSASGSNQFQLYTYDKANNFTNGDGANSIANIALDGGFIKTHGVTTDSTTQDVQPYTANKWYTITLRVNTNTHTYDFYVNGVLRVSNAIFRTTTGEIDLFNIAAGNAGNGYGELWVDYINVYQGEPQWLQGAEYTVTYDSGTYEPSVTPASPSAQVVHSAYTDCVEALPAAPVRLGYTFEGWQMANTSTFTADTPVTESITVTAQWTEAQAAVLQVEFSQANKNTGTLSAAGVGNNCTGYATDISTVNVYNDGASQSSHVAAEGLTVGAYIEFTFTLTAASNYTVLTHWRSGARATAQLSIDGNNIGEPLNMFAESAAWNDWTAGTAELAAGSHTVRYTVTDISKGTTMRLDYLLLTPVN